MYFIVKLFDANIKLKNEEDVEKINIG